MEKKYLFPPYSILTFIETENKSFFSRYQNHMRKKKKNKGGKSDNAGNIFTTIVITIENKQSFMIEIDFNISMSL